jgi:peroxiredoxin
MLTPLLSLRSVVPSFRLPALNRDSALGPWHYKQRASLVLFLFHDGNCAACRTFLLTLSSQHFNYRTLETEVLAIATTQPTEGIETFQKFVVDQAILFPVLWDQAGTVRATYLGWDKDTSPQALSPERSPVGIFVCDRFGELHMQAIAEDADQLPNELEIREWVEFVDMQCPECFPPAWR